MKRAMIFAILLLGTILSTMTVSAGDFSDNKAECIIFTDGELISLPDGTLDQETGLTCQNGAWGEPVAASNAENVSAESATSACTAIPQWAEPPRFNITAEGLIFDGSFPSVELAGSPNFRLVDWYPYVGAQSVSYVWRPTNDVLTRTGFGIMYELMGCDEVGSVEMSVGFAQVRHGLNNPSDSGLVVLMQDGNVIAIEANLANLTEADVVNVLVTQHGWNQEQVTAAFRAWANS